MKAVKEELFLDAVAEEGDQFVIEVQRRPEQGEGKATVYIHVNGKTVVRIGHVSLEMLNFLYLGEYK